MSRDLTTGVKAEVLKSEVEPVVFVKMEFTTTMYVWSGVGAITWDSHTWSGVGNFGNISPAKETKGTQAESMTFELSGIPSDMLSIALEENYQGRGVSAWLGFMSSGSILADPTMFFSGFMDVMTISEQGDSCTVSVTAESVLADLLKTREWRYTHEDQIAQYPGDKGLEFVAALQDKEILWGPH